MATTLEKVISLVDRAEGNSQCAWFYSPGIPGPICPW